MDYSLASKNPQQTNRSFRSKDKMPYSNRSSPFQPSERNTPSPNRAQKQNKQPSSSLFKPYLQYPQSTEQYTPLAISPSQLLSAHTPEDIDQLIAQHRYEVETLLLEIGRLQEELAQSHQQRQVQVRKAKQQFEETSFLQISQIRQNQHEQAQVFQIQIRKLKEQLADKTTQAKRLENLLQRQKQANEREKCQFKEQVRALIEKKNTQIFELKQEGDNKLRQFEFEKSNQIEQIRYTCDKEMSSLNKTIELYQDELNKLKTSAELQNKEKQNIIQYLEKQKENIEKRYDQRLVQQEKKYENIRQKFNSLINELSEDSQKSRTQLQHIFQSEHTHLISMLKTLEKDNQQLRKQLQSELVAQQIERLTFCQEKQQLQQKIKQSSEQSLKDMELLKVKLAALHENDLKNIKQLYELKLKHSSAHLIRLDEESSKLREFTNILSAEKYEQKKKYEMTISHLNSKILKMRMGISTMQNQFREKIENQKSVLLMTSRSFLKEAEVKTSNNKFLQEEIRKLRQLMDLQGRESENAEKAVQQKILAANNELERLSSKVLIIAKEKKDLEVAMEDMRAEKDQEISKLKAEIDSVQMPQRGIAQEIKIIEELKHQLGEKKQQIGILQDKIHTLESRMKEMEAERERLQMENLMSTDQIRKDFHVVAESHLENFKKYYEEKLSRIEEEKGELKKIVSSQYEQITQLIKKYKQTEEDLKEAVKVMKKRTQLQEKVMNIGLDCSLIKGMAQLLPTSKKT